MKKLIIGLLCATLVIGARIEHAASVAIPSDSASTSAAKAVDTGPDIWPKTVDEFLAGNYLQRADVVLTRREWDPTSYVIRWATGSPFSHTAMVFTGPAHEQGYGSTFIIEAASGGVDLNNFRSYVEDENTFVAIKRVSGTWFDPNKQARVRGLLLENIKAEYNYWAVARIVRDIWFGIQKTIEGQEETVESFRDRDWKPPNSFICSGLVQVGFVEAISEYVMQRQLPPWALNAVVFHPEAASRLPPPEAWADAPPELIDDVVPQFRVQLATELEAVTPEDIASTDKLEWLYFIRAGKVHKVSSYEEVKKLIE